MSAVKRAAWKKPEPDSAKLDALLDAAAVELNARGIAGARLAHVAKQVGIGRAALYYYVDSREDLAYRSYLRACRATAQDLATARNERNGLARLICFLRLALDPQRAPAVVLSEIAYLGGEQRREIDAAHARNMRGLRRFVEDGIEDRSLRDCDANIRARAAEALCDLVENGTAADPDAPFHCPLDFADFAFRPGNVFDRRDASEHKVELLLMTASRLFNQRGIDGTSLDDITAALGATKGAFYHHLPQKRTLVMRCQQRATDLYERFAEAASKAGATGYERTMIGLHLNVQAQASDHAPLSPLTGLEMLPASALRDIRARSERITKRFEKFNHDGIADRSLRKFDV